MSALPADVALYTQDGVLVRSAGVDANAVRAAYPEARDEEESPRETFFRYEADAIAVEATRYTFLKRLAPQQEELEVDQALGIGGAISLSPKAPKYTVVPSAGETGYVGIVRAYVHNTKLDRFALSILEG